MWSMIISGVVSSVFGAVFLCAPRWLAQPVARRGQVWIETTGFFLAHRISAGICFIAVGVFCLSSAWYVWLRVHG